jgi:hypothetical protein
MRSSLRGAYAKTDTEKTPMSQEDRFPPKNRQPISLDVLRIELHDANGIQVFDPNSLIEAVIKNTIKLAASQTRMSDITGFPPAIVYKAMDLKLYLSIDELKRMVRLSLEPREYFALRHKYGMSFEWHDDFYWEDTGQAVQPR